VVLFLQLILVLIAVFFASFAYGGAFESPLTPAPILLASEQPAEEDAFDFILVGSGPAGSVLVCSLRDAC
jgi:hypothetical protein